jgi:hypothetical protein
VREAGADVGHAELLDEELAKLERPRGEIEGGGFVKDKDSPVNSTSATVSRLMSDS